MASQADPIAVAAAAHSCPQCSKTFARLCDLNKHAKSHSRPYKCKDTDCKYNTLGWPTAKELERHYNDKHSATPRTFPCRFQPCPYWSKRESNCKQHMEKAHGWKYVKSKSRTKGQRKADGSACLPKDSRMSMGAEQSHPVDHASPRPPTVITSPTDFVLFDDQADAISDDENRLHPGNDESQGSESYLPWTSPVTRLRNNELFIEKFSQAYKGIQAKSESGAIRAGSGVEGHQEAQGYGQFVDDLVIKVESPRTVAGAVSARKRKYGTVEAAPAAFAQPASGTGQRRRKAGAGEAASAPSKAPRAAKHGGGSSDDGRWPRKRAKPNPAEDFTDTSMPDIFRYAHPQIYDINQTDKFSACHTVHREISTLIRHLSRPAHRLNVTERTISSFDVEDADYKHPKVGVCRSCWQTFDDRGAFAVHMSQACQRVSKGKREKWRVLFESFTPLLETADVDMSGTAATQSAQEEWERPFGSSQLDIPSSNEAGTPPTSVPSPATLHPPDFVPAGQRPGTFVSADDHDKLQKEHQALLERHRQLKRMAQVLLMQQVVQETMKRDPALEHDVRPTTLCPSKPRRTPASRETSDRDSLVQYMDSQPTDVDVYGFMDEMEDTHQPTPDDVNSNRSSSSRSAIHRVPPSPPSRPVELPSLFRSDDDGGPTDHQVKHHHPLAQRPPPPSIPDSGYGTEQRRGSLGDAPRVVTAKTMMMTVSDAGLFGPTPPSTAPADESQSQKPDDGEGVAWAPVSYSQSNLRAVMLSPPHHSQQQQQQQAGGSGGAFLIDQDMAEDYDPAYRIFYQDSNPHSLRSPPGFVFEPHSLPE